MARTLIQTGDPIVAAGNAILPDIKNRYLREIWASFQEEHYFDGTHKSPYAYFDRWIPGTYTGDGELTQEIDLSALDVGIFMVLVWSVDDGYIYSIGPVQHEQGGRVLSKRLNYPYVMDTILEYSNTTETITVSGALNTNSTAYVYVIFGRSQQTTSGNLTNPPTYVQHGDAMLGGIASTNANKVEDHLDTIFQAEHTEGGVHDASVFSGLSRYYYGQILVNFTSNTVQLLQSGFTPSIILFWTRFAGPTYLYVSGMPRLIDFTATALTTDGQVTVGYEQFTMNTASFRAQETLLSILSNTTDGSQVFTDSSNYGFTVTSRSPETSLPAHSTTQAHTGASSIKFLATAIQSLYVPFYTEQTNYYGPILTQSIGYDEDFEIDFWIYLPASPAFSSSQTTYTVLFNSPQPGIVIVVRNLSGTTGNVAACVLKYDASTAGGADPDDSIVEAIVGTSDLDDATWHQITVTRASGLTTLKVDTVQEGSTTAEFNNTVLWTYYWGYADITADRNEFYIDDITVKRTPKVFRYSGTYDYIALG